MEVGLVRQIDIDKEMQQSYLDYAMSVIVARALPDARDGLKPVHRRILHAMHAMGIRSDSSFKKSARIVGEVLGKYHPHGDMAVYDAMVRMAQNFSMRYPIIQGQGNFGSMDGDPAAAMRYTEARISPIAARLLSDLDKNTVEFLDNFDGSLKEPTVLPAAIPNLLLNGVTGIAVGMATSIPPHNMGEICDALIFLLKKWTRIENVSLDDLMQFVKGPDFPTGGIIIQDKAVEGEGLSGAYRSGRGKVKLQAKVHFESMGRGRTRIIVSELPYQTNKSSLIERIAELARGNILEGISDLRDESDRQGMRIVIELTKTTDPEKILGELYRKTAMQGTFSIIMLALVDGEPRLLNLKQALRVYIEHRIEIVTRRSQFELDRATQRSHILEGLHIALKNLDDVIQLIRSSRDSDQARIRLCKRFQLSEPQAQAILEMPLRRLSGLERKKIQQEYKEVQQRIINLQKLLASENEIRAQIVDELILLKAEFADPRRTQIVRRKGKAGYVDTPLTATDLAVPKATWVVLTKSGVISRTPSARLPRLAGRHAPALIIGASGKDNLYLFESGGAGVAIPIHVLPEIRDPSKGVPLNSVSPFDPSTQITAGIAIPADYKSQELENLLLIFCTRKGVIKRTSLSAFPGPSSKKFKAINIANGDALQWVRLPHGKDEIILVSRRGMAIRFSESSFRPTGLSAAGVSGMKLGKESDAIVGMSMVIPGSDLFLISQDGLAKRTKISEFPQQGRYGKGVLAWKSGSAVQLAGAGVGLPDQKAAVMFAKSHPRSIRYSDAPRRSRTSPGDPIFEMKEGDKIKRLVPVQLRSSRSAKAINRPPAQKGKTTKKRPMPGKKAKRQAKTQKSKAKSGIGKQKTKSRLKPRTK